MSMIDFPMENSAQTEMADSDRNGKSKQLRNMQTIYKEFWTHTEVKLGEPTRLTSLRDMVATSDTRFTIGVTRILKFTCCLCL